MDKYEYKVRADEIKELIEGGKFAEALQIAETIDWKRVKSVMMLCTISDLYKINRRFQESKDILLLAYERHPGGRLIVYSLCELSVKMGEYVQAIEYYKEFVQIAPKDTGRYILQYKLYEAQDVSLEERIAVLEEFKKRDYREKWAYELAYLYHRVGLETKCIEECEEMILWFGEGRYVMKALELKALHQPLSQSQKDKYYLLKNEMEKHRAAQETEEENDRYVAEDEVEEDDEEDRKEEDFSEESDSDFGQHDNIQIRTADVSQYNTVNLQKELAASMKELLGEGNSEEEKSSMGTITQSIVAPLLQETEEMSDLKYQPDGEGVLDHLTATGILSPFGSFSAEEDLSVDEEQVNTQTLEEASENVGDVKEEVFFEEDAKDILTKDILTKDTREINIGKQPERLGDTKEIDPNKKIIYPSTLPFNNKNATFAPDVSSPEMTQQQPRMTLVQPAIQKAMPLTRSIQPTGFDQMLSQEYDGQISLVVPEKAAVEKQITGQMNIVDIMAEWERMKKQNEEKRRDDVRKRVQQHTGNMFADFDEATKTGLLEQLEKAVVAAILKESGENPIDPSSITPKKVSEMVDYVKNSAKEQKETEEKVEADISESAENVIGENDVVEELVEIDIESDEEDLEQEETSVQKNENAAEKNENAATENIKNIVEDMNRLRPLSEEEKELFARFVHNKRAKEQLIHTVDTMSMDSYTDNIIVTGEAGSGTIDLAKGIIRMMQMSDSNFSGKVAKISGTTLNKKNVENTLSKLADGAIIIEGAAAMSTNAASDLNKALSKENSGLLVILEGTKEEINKFFEKNNVLEINFNCRIDVEALDDHSLVEYARQYAEEQEYSIDELGILALHTRIAEMQTSDHEVTVTEVRELVDDAIYFADKKNLKHLFDVLLGKRYDEEDMIVLREKDFMHY